MKHHNDRLNGDGHNIRCEKEVIDTGSCNDFGTGSTTFGMLRPLVWSMGLFGLIHVNDKKSKWNRITQVYSTLVVILMWATFARQFALYASECQLNANFFKVIIFHTWTFLCAVEATITNKACRKQNKFQTFMKRWPKLMDTRKNLHEDIGYDPEDSFKRRNKIKFVIFVLVSWAYLVFFCGLVGYLAFQRKELDFLVVPLTGINAVLLKVATYIMFVYLSASWVFSLSLYIVLTVAIYQQFEIFDKSFRKAAMDNTEIADVENYRRRHLEICKQVETADEIMGTINAAGIFESTFIGMLVLYCLVVFEANVYVNLTYSFWFVNCMVYIAVISFGGGYLNHMAHAPLRTLHDVRLRRSSSEDALQVTMFLSKLTGESIGLTAMGMFVINRPTILTIAGAFVTYFIVLLQYQQPSTLPGAPCNCSAVIGH